MNREDEYGKILTSILKTTKQLPDQDVKDKLDMYLQQMMIGVSFQSYQLNWN